MNLASSSLGHDIVPKPGTVRQAATGQPGSLLRVLDYPLIAECMTCDRAIRIDLFFMADWYHIDSAEVSSGSDPKSTSPAVLAKSASIFL